MIYGWNIFMKSFPRQAGFFQPWIFEIQEFGDFFSPSPSPISPQLQPHLAAKATGPPSLHLRLIRFWHPQLGTSERRQWALGEIEAPPLAPINGWRWGGKEMDFFRIYTGYGCYLYVITSSTAQGGGGSFKKRKTIGEIGCCESRMSKQRHWPTD